MTAPTRKPREGDDPKRLAWVRSQRCAVCVLLGRAQLGRSNAQHPRGHEYGTGTGIKAADADAWPLCGSGTTGCHGDWTNATGHFKDWTKAERQDFERGMVTFYRVLWRVKGRAEDE